MASNTIIDLVQVFNPCHCYIDIINKYDEIPAYLYLAKHTSLILLFLFKRYSWLCSMFLVLCSTEWQWTIYMGKNASPVKNYLKHHAMIQLEAWAEQSVENWEEEQAVCSAQQATSVLRHIGDIPTIWRLILSQQRLNLMVMPCQSHF